MSAPDFIAVGHVTLDRVGDATRPGGAALYAAVTAHRLGLSVGLLTSHGDDFPLDLIPSPIEVVSVPAEATSVFEHRAVPGGREMRVITTARPLSANDVPEDWRDAGLALLAPVIDEVDPAVTDAFSDATIAAAAQGWLRRLAPAGEVVARPWTPPAELLGRLQALVVSTDDVRGQESRLTEWLQRLPFAVVTAGAHGALLYVNGERYDVRPRPAREVDATGAGDVFAATFVIRYHLDGDPWQAAAAATCAASLAVEGAAWSTVPDRAKLDAALHEYLRAD